MDALFSKPMHITVWNQIRGRPVVEEAAADEARSVTDSIEKKKPDVAHVA